MTGSVGLRWGCCCYMFYERKVQVSNHCYFNSCQTLQKIKNKNLQCLFAVHISISHLNRQGSSFFFFLTFQSKKQRPSVYYYFSQVPNVIILQYHILSYFKHSTCLYIYFYKYIYIFGTLQGCAKIFSKLFQTPSRLNGDLQLMAFMLLFLGQNMSSIKK